MPVDALQRPSNRQGAQERSNTLIAVAGQASAAFFAQSVRSLGTSP